MSSNDVFLTPATAAGGTSIPNLTWDQFIALVYNELVAHSLVVEGGSGGGSGVDPVPLIETHRIDTTNVHGIANTASLVLTSDARLTNARTPVTHAHAEADITSLLSDLLAKADAVHAHAESDVTNLAADLASKAASVHNHDTAYYTKSQVDTLLAAVSGGAIDLTPTWLNLVPATGFQAYPSTFLDTIDVCLFGGHLVHFRGVVDVTANVGNGDRIFTLPGSIPVHATAVRRLAPQSGGQSVVGLNVNPDRTVHVAAAVSSGAFISLDDLSYIAP